MEKLDEDCLCEFVFSRLSLRDTVSILSVNRLFRNCGIRCLKDRRKHLVLKITSSSGCFLKDDREFATLPIKSLKDFTNPLPKGQKIISNPCEFADLVNEMVLVLVDPEKTDRNPSAKEILTVVNKLKCLTEFTTDLTTLKTMALKYSEILDAVLKKINCFYLKKEQPFVKRNTEIPTADMALHLTSIGTLETLSADSNGFEIIFQSNNHQIGQSLKKLFLQRQVDYSGDPCSLIPEFSPFVTELELQFRYFFELMPLQKLESLSVLRLRQMSVREGNMDEDNYLLQRDLRKEEKYRDCEFGKILDLELYLRPRKLTMDAILRFLEKFPNLKRILYNIRTDLKDQNTEPLRGIEAFVEVAERSKMKQLEVLEINHETITNYSEALQSQYIQQIEQILVGRTFKLKSLTVMPFGFSCGFEAAQIANILNVKANPNLEKFKFCMKYSNEDINTTVDELGNVFKAAKASKKLTRAVVTLCCSDDDARQQVPNKREIKIRQLDKKLFKDGGAKLISKLKHTYKSGGEEKYVFMGRRSGEITGNNKDNRFWICFVKNKTVALPY